MSTAVSSTFLRRSPLRLTQSGAVSQGGHWSIYSSPARSHYPQWDTGHPMLYMVHLSRPIADSNIIPPSSSPLNVWYTKQFIQVKDTRDLETEDPWGATKPPIVHDVLDLCHAHSGDPHKFFGWGIYSFTHYVWTKEPLFPDKPNLERGELAAGANLMRTDVWKTADEPAVVSIGRFAPDNFRAKGYAQNAPVPSTATPTHVLDFRSNRLPIGHADRRPAYQFTALVSSFVGITFLRMFCVKAAYFWWPAKDVWAASSIEVDISDIRMGQNWVGDFQGKPVFIKRRSPEDIEYARKDDALVGSLRDPQLDCERVKRPEWLVVIGVCTHLGCIPFPDAGDYRGYFCPCHGSHYDISGRIRRGPAGKNLQVPPYQFLDDTTIKIG